MVLGAGKRWGAPMPVPVEPSCRARSTCALILTHHNPGIEPIRPLRRPIEPFLACARSMLCERG